MPLRKIAGSPVLLPERIEAAGAEPADRNVVVLWDRRFGAAEACFSFLGREFDGRAPIVVGIDLGRPILPPRGVSRPR